jgi:hypothetical protein
MWYSPAPLNDIPMSTRVLKCWYCPTTVEIMTDERGYVTAEMCDALQSAGWFYNGDDWICAPCCRVRLYPYNDPVASEFYPLPLSRPPLTYEAANRIWDVLREETWVQELEREFFVHEYMRPFPAVPSWPCRPRLGRSGKFVYDGIQPPHVRIDPREGDFEADLVGPVIEAANQALLAAANEHQIRFRSPLPEFSG